MPRPGFRATHHLTLSAPYANKIRTRADGLEQGTLTSPQFVTFGPPMPQNGQQPPASGEYFFEPVFLMANGTEFAPGPIDVTGQVNRTIERLLEHYGDGDVISPDENIFEIVIDDEIVLPVVASSDDPSVIIDPWPDDEIIIVWI